MLLFIPQGAFPVKYTRIQTVVPFPVTNFRSNRPMVKMSLISLLIYWYLKEVAQKKEMVATTNSESPAVKKPPWSAPLPNTAEASSAVPSSTLFLSWLLYWNGLILPQTDEGKLF